MEEEEDSVPQWAFTAQRRRCTSWEILDWVYCMFSGALSSRSTSLSGGGVVVVDGEDEEGRRGRKEMVRNGGGGKDISFEGPTFFSFSLTFFSGQTYQRMYTNYGGTKC